MCEDFESWNGIAGRSGDAAPLYGYMDGSMRMHYKGRILACTAYNKLPMPSQTENEKTIDARINR